MDAFEHGWYTDYVNNGSAYTSSFRSTTPPLGFSDVFEDCKTLYQYTMGNYVDVTGTQFFLPGGVKTCSIYGEAEISHTFADLTPNGYYEVSVAIDELDYSNFTEDGLTYTSGSTDGFEKVLLSGVQVTTINGPGSFQLMRTTGKTNL